jgi:hypothetical protein
MKGTVQALGQGASADLTPALVPEPDLKCRVCELETENTRLRLLVSELLVKNQGLREDAKRLRGNQASSLEPSLV